VLSSSSSFINTPKQQYNTVKITKMHVNAQNNIKIHIKM